ncbi:MAG: 1-deoxy-D-xylulose-5-phosphate reductoisomerase [Candidatus Competibacteraceae bacterium]|nr:1-deoxy-D-xylulose-5-phosphate reductoisomerase [Candidatus Competibacteraceae bacterium]
MKARAGVAILGATGSIGVSTLDVVRRHADRFRVVALTAHRDVEALLEQCLVCEPDYAVMADETAAERLRDRLRAAGRPVEVLAGAAGLERVAVLPEVDRVMAAIVGAAGLLPTLAAARAGKRVLLANKEALVMAGSLFMAAVRDHGAELLPIDSEHNAVFQCLPSGFATAGLEVCGVRRILLTGSGGPFRATPLDQLSAVTPDQACAHPNWRMGRKISVDSATMMNKGLEVIEARWLFGAPSDRIEVVVHPQSVIHSMVEYQDGSVLAQLGHPDMRTPIAHALAWPGRMDSGVAFLDFARLTALEFQAPDFTRFPALRLARSALAAGGTAPAILNAANEVAVQAFLDRRIRFTDIAVVVEQTLEQVAGRAVETLTAVLDDDARARAVACEQVAVRAVEG